MVGALVDSHHFLGESPESREEDRSIVADSLGRWRLRFASFRFVLERETRRHSSRSRRNMLTATESRCANRRPECLPIDDNANFHDCSLRPPIHGFPSMSSPTFQTARRTTDILSSGCELNVLCESRNFSPKNMDRRRVTSRRGGREI